MNQVFTHEDLIRFTYGEAPRDLAQQIKDAAANDPVLMEEINQIRVVQHSLNKLKFSPSNTSINIILQYSKNYEELEASF